MYIMKRTQLNLDEKTYYQLVGYARQEKTSLSSAARKLISKQIQKERSTNVKNHPLLGLIAIGKKYKMKGPHDLSTNLDYYLYGEGSPKFGKQLKK